ncbi:hypothetical protein Scep_028886 [Stephania cephalantha]|uniref:Uncharacterized protein n=1 Tax=Stephania cephalantha TaxID=152367 RepID=A0AAP0HK15_9MAGN
MVSDQEIANGVESLLRQANPNAVTSINGVVQQLEAKLGLDLSHKAGFIRDQIELLLRHHHARPPPPPPPPLPPTHKDNHHFVYQFQNPQFQQLPPRFTLTRPDLGFAFAPPGHGHGHGQGQVQHHPQLFQQPIPQVLQQQQQQQQQPQPPRHHPIAPVKPAGGNVVTASPQGGKESGTTGTKRRGGPGGLNKLCGVSPVLQAIVGEPALSRTQIVKQLWAYIRQNNLQDPNNKRRIICNDALRLVFETDCTDMFKMNKLLAKHIIPLEPSKEPGSDSKRLKVETEPATENAEAAPSTVIMSDTLAKFLGAGGKEIVQLEAVGRVWEYIKVNNLEDPLNSMTVICDQKLQELFGCESISKVGVSEMLARHFYKQS